MTFSYMQQLHFAHNSMLSKPIQSHSCLCLSSISGKIYSAKAHPVFSLLPHFIKLTHHSYFLSIIWLWLSSRITTTRRGAMVVFHGFPSVSLIHFSELPQAAMISWEWWHSHICNNCILHTIYRCLFYVLRWTHNAMRDALLYGFLDVSLGTIFLIASTPKCVGKELYKGSSEGIKL